MSKLSLCTLLYKYIYFFNNYFYFFIFFKHTLKKNSLVYMIFISPFKRVLSWNGRPIRPILDIDDGYRDDRFCFVQSSTDVNVPEKKNQKPFRRLQSQTKAIQRQSEALKDYQKLFTESKISSGSIQTPRKSLNS